MVTATEPVTNLFEQTFESLRTATKSAIDMQQEAYTKWVAMWPKPTRPTDQWTASVEKFQKEWTSTVTELLWKHRERLYQQYEAGIKSLEEAFTLASSKDPEEFRGKCEALCRSALDTMKQSSEEQMKLFQDVMNKWIEACPMKS